MPRSNAAKGAYYKGKTKLWLQAQGYQVADLEVVRWIFVKGGRLPVKRDQFGADLLAVNATEIRFVQVKSGEAARGGTFPAARRTFGEFVFPPSAPCCVIAWPPRARTPRIVVM